MINEWACDRDQNPASSLAFTVFLSSKTIQTINNFCRAKYNINNLTVLNTIKFK